MSSDDRDDIEENDSEAVDEYEEKQLAWDRRERERAQLLIKKQQRKDRISAVVGDKKNVNKLKRQLKKNGKRKRSINDDQSDNDTIQISAEMDDDDINLQILAEERRKQEEAESDQAFVSAADEEQQFQDAENEMEKEKWLGVSMESHVFEDEKETEKSDDPEYCYMCDYSPSRLDTTGAESYQLMVEFIQCQWGTVDTVWLISKAQEMYNDGLREHTEFQRPWYKRKIYEHFMKHHPTTRFILENQLQTYRKVLTTIENNGIFEQSTTRPGVIRVNKQQADLYMNFCKEMRPLLKELKQLRQSTTRQ